MLHNIELLKIVSEISGKHQRGVYIFEILDRPGTNYTLMKNIREHIRSCKNAGWIEVMEQTALFGERYKLTEAGNNTLRGV